MFGHPPISRLLRCIVGAFFDVPQFANLPDRRTAWLGSLGISAAQQVTIMKREVHVPAQRGKMIGGHQLYRKPCYNDFR